MSNLDILLIGLSNISIWEPFLPVSVVLFHFLMAIMLVVSLALLGFLSPPWLLFIDLPLLILIRLIHYITTCFGLEIVTCTKEWNITMDYILDLIHQLQVTDL